MIATLLQTDETLVSDSLHIGVVLDGPIVPAWIAKTIFDIRQEPFVSQVDFVFLSPAQAEPAGSALFHRYLRRFGAVPNVEDDPLKEVDLATQLPEEALRQSACTSADWDVVLWLSARELEQHLECRGRHGVWRVRHSHPYQSAGAAEYFWELYDLAPISGTAIENVEPGKPSATISEAFSATEVGWSLGRNRLVPYWKAAALIKKALKELSQERNAHKRLAPIEARERRPLPTNAQMVKFVARHAVRTISRRLLYSHQEASWFVAYRTNKQNFVSVRGEFDPVGFRELAAPADHFYADPFVHKWRGRNYLFFEDYLYAERKGVLSVVEMTADGPIGEVTRILDLPYHLSYPFVFEQDGSLFMIPETLSSGRIELYTSIAPAGPWRLEKILQENMKAADTTLWVENGIYYFLTSVVENGVTPNDHLHIFWTKELTGEWRPHQQNPVSSDVRNSRGAGNLFRRDGKLIRPAQDCSVRYGYACQLNEVQELSPESFREKTIGRIEPHWLPGMIGTHTLNANEDIEVIDGQVLRSRYSKEGESGIARLQSGWRRRSAAGRLRKLGQTSITLPSRI